MTDSSSIWTVVFLLTVGVGLLFEILFLLNLRETLRRVSDKNRSMPADYVWFSLIPLFGLGWFIYTVVKIRDSLRAEYRSRSWTVEGDFGYSMGLAAAVLAIVSAVWAAVSREFLVAELVLAAGQLVCWVAYWVKIAQVKRRLGPAMRMLHAGTVVPEGTADPDEGVRHCKVCRTVVMPTDRYCWRCGSPLR